MLSGCLGTASAFVASAFAPIPWHDIGCPIGGATVFLFGWKSFVYMFQVLDTIKPRRPRPPTSPGQGTDASPAASCASSLAAAASGGVPVIPIETRLGRFVHAAESAPVVPTTAAAAEPLHPSPESVTPEASVTAGPRSGRAGRPRPTRLRRAFTKGFNPRPVRMGRATVILPTPRVVYPVSIHARSGWAGRRDHVEAPVAGDLKVSIHARSGWAGRPTAKRMPGAIVLFQSTPGPDGPGDLVRVLHRSSTSSFNPRPVRMGRATPSSLTGIRFSQFQSTPGPDGPGDLPAARR